MHWKKIGCDSVSLGVENFCCLIRNLAGNNVDLCVLLLSSVRFDERGVGMTLLHAEADEQIALLCPVCGGRDDRAAPCSQDCALEATADAVVAEILMTCAELELVGPTGNVSDEGRSEIFLSGDRELGSTTSCAGNLLLE